jgi:hypothetical protein
MTLHPIQHYLQRLNAALAPFTDPDHLSLFLAGGTAVALIRPPLGLAALLVGSLVIPFTVGTGTQTELNFPFLFVPLIMTLWLAKTVRSRDFSLFTSRPVRPLIIFVWVAVVSFLMAAHPWRLITMTAPLSAQFGGLAVFVLSAGAFLLVADQIRDLRWLQFLTWLFLGLGALYLVGWLVPGIGALGVPTNPRGADGGLFWTWLVALAFSQAMFNRRLHLLGRLGTAGLACAALYVGIVVLRDWLSGWLPPLIAVGTILWVGAPRLGCLATLGCVAAAAVNLPNVITKVTTLVASGDNPYSLSSRIAAWRALAKIICFNPVLGLGPANYYHSTPLFPILGYYVHFSSHNTYVDLIAQTGFLGLGCFLWFVWEVGRLGWTLRKRVPAGFAQAYVYGALGGLVGTLASGMLGDWVLPFVYNVTLTGFRASVLGWLFLGGIVAIERMTHAEPDQR